MGWTVQQGIDVALTDDRTEFGHNWRLVDAWDCLKHMDWVAASIKRGVMLSSTMLMDWAIKNGVKPSQIVLVLRNGGIVERIDKPVGRF